MNNQIGIIGYGNLGKALSLGLTKSNIVRDKNIFILTRKKSKPEYKSSYAFCKTTSVSKIASKCRILFITLKSSQLKGFIEQNKLIFKRNNNILVSMCSGISINKLSQFNKDILFVKTISNVNMETSNGYTVIYSNNNVSLHNLKTIVNYFKKLGLVYIAENEEECDILSTFTATLPALVATFLSGIIDAGLNSGVRKDLAYNMAIDILKQTVDSIWELNLHPEVYKQKITSPGGVVVKGLQVLENHKFRYSLIKSLEIIKDLVVSYDK